MTTTMSKIARTLPLFLMLAACGDNPDASRFILDWQLQYVGVGGRAVSCQAAGTPKIRMSVRHTGTKAVQDFTFSCDGDGGRALTDPLPVGAYDVEIALLDKADQPVAERETFRSAINRHDATFLFDGTLVFPIQSFVMTWAVCRESGSACTPTNCATVNAKSVELRAQLPNRDLMKFKWECAAGAGTTTAIPVGTYGLTGHLLDSAGNEISLTRDPLSLVVGLERRAEIPTLTFAVKP